jgi:hypothetical protein
MLRIKSDCVVNGFAVGCTKYCCFLCEWDSRDKKNHYIKEKWSKCESITPGKKNVVHLSPVNSDMIILLLLHVTVGRGTWQSQIATHHVTRHNTPIHTLLSSAPQLGISQKALGTLPEDNNVMPKHVGANIHNQ